MSQRSVSAPAAGGILSDVRVQLPIGFLAAIPLIQNQVRTNKTKDAVLFIFFCVCILGVYSSNITFKIAGLHPQ
jgi:hypothetical protein